MIPKTHRVEDDHFHDHCGVFGVFGHPEAAKLTYLGLYALQHRGQESAGIASSDGADCTSTRAWGRSRKSSRPMCLRSFPGARPSANALFDGGRQHLKRAADGDRLQQGQSGAGPQRQPDECARSAAPAGTSRLDFPDHQRHGSDRASDRAQRGAQSCRAHRRRAQSSGRRVFAVLLTRDEMYAIRDPRGFRPLVAGAPRWRVGGRPRKRARSI